MICRRPLLIFGGGETKKIIGLFTGQSGKECAKQKAEVGWDFETYLALIKL